jgi:hypothetical protein
VDKNNKGGFRDGWMVLIVRQTCFLLDWSAHAPSLCGSIHIIQYRFNCKWRFF